MSLSTEGSSLGSYSREKTHEFLVLQNYKWLNQLFSVAGNINYKFSKFQTVNTHQSHPVGGGSRRRGAIAVQSDQEDGCFFARMDNLDELASLDGQHFRVTGWKRWGGGRCFQRRGLRGGGCSSDKRVNNYITDQRCGEVRGRSAGLSQLETASERHQNKPMNI